MRFCKGDGPAVELECGQQRGGYFYCAGCAIHANRIHELDHAFRCPSITLEERQQSILRGPISRKYSLALRPNPCDNLTKAELEQEIRGRKLTVGTSTTKSAMQKALVSDLRGKKRVPALLYCSPESSLENLNIEDYEVLPCEPMHDMAGHIGNILQELPHHLPPEQAQLLRESTKLATEGKDKKRACDQRCSIIVASSQMRQKASLKVQQLLNTLVEMQGILYASEDERCPQSVLRYHNQSFLHAILCFEVMGYQPSTMTCRKLYGKYFHGLINHAPSQLRIVSGTSVNAEDEERLFSSINGITKSTSSKHPGHIIGNVLIRLQAEEELREVNEGCRSSEQENKIKRMANSLPEFPDTLIPAYILQKYPREWQAHLERISDFLSYSGPERSWWEYDGENIVFHDSGTDHPDTRPEGPLLHHFRSSSIRKEETYLESCWSKCLEEEICLPSHYLFLPDQSTGGARKVATGFLHPAMPASVDYNSAVINPEFTEGVDDIEDESSTEVQVIDMSEISEDEDPSGNGKHNADEEMIIDPFSAEACPPEQEALLEQDNGREAVSTDLHQVGDLSSRDQQPVRSVSVPAMSASVPAVSASAIVTRLGQAVADVLGPTDNVQRLDNLRRRAKSTHSKYDYELYMNCLASVQTEVLHQKSVLEKSLKEWEQAYFINNNFRSPTIDDLRNDDHSSKLLRKIKSVKYLLKLWNITL